MFRRLCLSLTALVGCVTIAAAQQTASAMRTVPKPTGAEGTWTAKTMIGAKDSVVASYVLTVAPDSKSATITFPDRDAIPARIVALAGDSLVTEAGPFLSVLRPGQTVTLLRSVAHYKGDTMSGTFEATYENGDVVKGKTHATREPVKPRI
jgi:hypothetical protein